MTPAAVSTDRLEHLRHLESHLNSQILGQSPAIARVVPLLQRGELGLSKPGRPKGSFLFLGPTGVGKTELTIAFTRYLFGEGRLSRFDMSEYQTQESLAILLGGSVDEVGLFRQAIDGSGRGTLLFDEIEKAHPRVLDLFLQILDAGRVTMANGETLDLSGYYIVLTSNIGGADLLNLQHSSYATMERHVLARAQQSLRPELFARITEKLVFNRLSYDVQLEIAELHLGRELAFLGNKGFDISVGGGVVQFLMQKGFHPRLGARPLRDAIEKHVTGAVADATLAEISSGCGTLVVVGNELVLSPPPGGQTPRDFA